MQCVEQNSFEKIEQCVTLSSPSEGLDRHADMPSRSPQWSTLSTSNQAFHQLLTHEHKPFSCYFYFYLHLTPSLVLVPPYIFVIEKNNKKFQRLRCTKYKTYGHYMRTSYNILALPQHQFGILIISQNHVHFSV